MTIASNRKSPWISLASVPDALKAPRFVMEPLEEKHAELDFQALMSCRARLREELQWGEWPPEDFTLQLNRSDLKRHHNEFVRGEAFAYTILRRDRSRCIGCVYLERCVEIEGAQLAFWVIDEALDIEAVLVTEVLQWVHRDWSINRVLIPLHETNTRGIAFALESGCTPWSNAKESSFSRYRCFLSESNGDKAV